MPRAIRVVLKACWATLAALLFITGLIGCDGNTGATPADAASQVADDGSRPNFESFQAVMSYYDFGAGITRQLPALSILYTGDVNAPPTSGLATPAELAAFADLASRPETIAAFARTDQCPAIGDGGDDVTLKMKDGPTYMRSASCDGVIDLVSAARTLGNAVRARAADGGSQ
jgi:hypothetical protein